MEKLPRRPYQEEALQFLSTHPRALEFDDMGLGKTRVVIDDLERRIHISEGTPTLVVCPTFAMGVWEEELKKWIDGKCLMYYGTMPKAQRFKRWLQYIHSHQVGVLLVTPMMLPEIMELTQEYKNESKFVMNRALCGYNWPAIVGDEIHLWGLLNHDTAAFKAFEKAARDIPLVRPMTGTPYRQGVIDLYAPLNIMDRVRFSSYWRFVGKYCITLETPFGKSIERRPKNPDEFREMLSHYMIRRIKDEVKKDTPGKQRQPIYCEMTPKQSKAYREIETTFMTITDNSVLLTPNQMTAVMRLRQLLVSPKLLDIDENGGPLDSLLDMCWDRLNNADPVVIFTPFRKAVEIIKQELLRRAKPRIYTIMGEMSADEFTAAWKGFQDNPSKEKVLICVIKSGASFHATAADKGFFLGCEWDFNLNEQAEDRLNRLGQKNFVNFYYMLCKDTVDMDVMQRLNDKVDNSHWTIGTEEQYNAILRRFKIGKAR